MSRVGSGPVNIFFKSRGSGRVGSRGFQTLADQVGSGRDMSNFARVGSVYLTRPDPTREVGPDRRKALIFATEESSQEETILPR